MLGNQERLESASVDLYSPYQLANSIGDPAYAQVRQTLAAELAVMRKCSGKACRAPMPH